MNLINVLLVLMCIAATIILTHIKKRLLHFSLKFGEKTSHAVVSCADRCAKAQTGKNVDDP